MSRGPFRAVLLAFPLLACACPSAEPVATGMGGAPVADSLVLVVAPPDSALLDSVLAPPPRVAVLRASSSRCSGGAQFVPVAGVPVEATLAAGSGVLAGETAALSDNLGVADFADLAISGATGPHLLRFSNVRNPAGILSDTVRVH